MEHAVSAVLGFFVGIVAVLLVYTVTASAILDDCSKLGASKLNSKVITCQVKP